MNALVTLMLAVVIVCSLGGCSHSDDQIDSKEVLSELLESGEWCLELFNADDDRAAGPVAQNVVFWMLDHKMQIGQLGVWGRWYLFYDDQLIWYDDIDAPAPDFSEQTHYHNLEDEKLYLSIIVDHPQYGDYNRRWELRRFSSSSVKLRCNNLILMLSKQTGPGN